MSFEVRIARRAAAQIRAASAWWEANRPAAPEAFIDEFERAVEFVRSMPHGGQPFADPEVIGVRRVALRRVRYHLYYVVSDEEHVVVVLALWHASRGERPPL